MTTREENRNKMPLVAAFVDEVRKYFPGAKVVYAREGDIEVGKRSERTGIIASEYWGTEETSSRRSGKNTGRR